MKKHLLIGASLLALGITTTAIYAQVIGTSIVDSMKAISHSFTLATSLNPSDSGLTSDPVKGKKTGDILTAGEWNRMLELVSEGGGGGGAGWVDVPLTDTNSFDQQCIYRFVTQGQTYYVQTVHENRLYWTPNTYFDKANKSVLVGGIAPFDRASKIEKLCGGGGSGGGVSNVEIVTSQDVGAAVGTSYANRWSEANCPAGKKIISGGCSYPNTRNSFIHNAPKSDLSGWTCGGIAYNGDISSTSAEYPTRPTSYAVCGVYGNGSGAGSSWADVPLTDTAAYDPDNCQYRFKLTGPVGPAGYDFSSNGYYNAYYVTPGLMESVSGIFIKSSSKNTVYAIDNSNNNVTNFTTALNWRPTKIEKKCN